MAKTVVKKKTSSQLSGRSVDFRFIFGRLEARLLEGRNIEKIGRLLESDRRWEKLDTEDRLNWAYLAQLAGRVDTALEILAAVNRSDPENRLAWQRRLDLLALLGRQKELVAIVAAAGRRIDIRNYLHWLPRQDRADQDVEVGLEPFLELEKMRRLKERFLLLFRGRHDCFARQWADRDGGRTGYVPVRRAMTPADLEDHFQGKATYGIYLMLEDSTVKTAVIDADLKPELRKRKPVAESRRQIAREKAYLFRRLEEFGRGLGTAPLVEFSGGKGYHFWFFFTEPVPAVKVRSLLGHWVERLQADLSCFGLELFPKQDSLEGRQLGNLVKLPLGVHRLSGRRSYFVACRSRKLEDQLALLEEVGTIAPKQVGTQLAVTEKAKVVCHPVMARQQEQYPELVTLEARCPALAGVFRACRQGLEIGLREEKIIFQTVGFLPRGKTLVHSLMRGQPEYNPHLVDFKLSRLRGSPLGCRRIHSLLDYVGDFCLLAGGRDYQHPLLHIDSGWKQKAEKIDSLQAALDNLDEALGRVKQFLK